MKRMKKLLAVMLAALMVVSMGGMSVMAATGSTGTYTIEITGATGHTYTAYQIFSGDYASGELTNIEWGTDIDTDNVATILSTMSSEPVYASYINDYLTNVSYNASDDASAVAVAKVLAGMQDDSDAITAFAVLVKSALKSNATGTNVAEDGTSGTYKADVSSIGAGYYLIVDATNTSLAEGDAISAYILEVVGQATATAKVDVPTLEKTIVDSNLTDSKSTAGIGDTIKYKLTSSVPDTSDYTEYTFKITDILSTGLEYQSSTLSVKVGDTVLEYVDSANVTGTTNKYTVDTSRNSSSGTTITIELVNFIDSAYTENAVIEITYEAKLTEDATVGNTGNTNTATLEYSNNPYDSGTGKTTETYVTTYTTRLTVTKIDGDLNAYTSDLNGITFTLKDSSGTAVGDAVEITSTNKGVITFTDLEAGTYTLEENVGTTGYSAVNITFTLTYDTSTSQWIVGQSASDTSNHGVTLTDAGGEYKVTIENNKGTGIPSTGGIGTTIFYVTGAILVLGAAVILITRKRMRTRA